jgi:hypothetical protein
MFRTSNQTFVWFCFEILQAGRKEKNGVFLGFSNKIIFQKMKFYSLKFASLSKQCRRMHKCFYFLIF